MIPSPVSPMPELRDIGAALKYVWENYHLEPPVYFCRYGDLKELRAARSIPKRARPRASHRREAERG